MTDSSDMMRAKGSFTDINFFRAWAPEQYTEISKKVSELVVCTRYHQSIKRNNFMYHRIINFTFLAPSL